MSAVARKFGRSPRSVFLSRQWYKDKTNLRIPTKTNDQPEQVLTRILLKGALSCGYSTDLWTTRRVAEVIKKEFGVDYHPNHLWRFLTTTVCGGKLEEKSAISPIVSPLKEAISPCISDFITLNGSRVPIT